jgi:hypothetical protein
VATPSTFNLSGLRRVISPPLLPSATGGPMTNPDRVSRRQDPAVQHQLPLLAIKDRPASQSMSPELALITVTVSASGAGSTGLTSAATMRTV